MSHLNAEQFKTEDIAFLPSRDYAGRIGDIEFTPGGESDKRVQEIMESAKTEGIREPLEVKGDDSRYLSDGHHRFVAAKRLGISVPVKGM